MISPVRNATQNQPAADSTPVNEKSTQSKPQPIATDTVQLSSAALAILQEATEIPAQTLKEARGGDFQARRLLAREAAVEAATEVSHSA